MKSQEPQMGPRDEGWRESQVREDLPASSARGPIPPLGGNNSKGTSLVESDPTCTFLHQLSQSLTSLRGTLELALLVEADAQEYRRAIQQSLVQAEGLVQLFKSYRARAQGGNGRPCE